MPRSGAKTALLFLVGAALLAALVAYVGVGRVVDALRLASPVYLGFAVASYAIFFLVRGIRWRMLFAKSAPDVRLSSTTAITAVGWLANSIIPLKGGDVLRAALISKREKVALGTSASTVALERVLDILGLAIVALVGFLLIPPSDAMPPAVGRALKIAWILPLLGLLILGVLVWLRKPTMRAAERTLGTWGKFGAGLCSFLDTTLAAVEALARRPILLAQLLPMTALVSVAQALVFAFLVMAFIPGAPFLLAFAGGALFLLSFVISITPGNVGTYEAAFGAVFIALGVPADVAVPAAILTHVTTTLIVAVLGSLGMLSLGLDGKKLAWRPARVPQLEGSP